MPLLASATAITVQGSVIEELALPQLEQLNKSNDRREPSVLSLSGNASLLLVDLPLLGEAASLVLSENDALEEVRAPLLTTMTGVVNFSSNGALVSFSMPKLDTVSSMEFSANEALEELHFPELTHLTGSFPDQVELQQNPVLHTARFPNVPCPVIDADPVPALLECR